MIQNNVLSQPLKRRNQMTKLLGGIELGGTKIVCALGNASGKIAKKVIIPTRTPKETIPQIIDFFKKSPQLQALGVACFGPLELNKSSPKYGYITATTKPSWEHFNLLGSIQESIKVPIGFDTDVNGAVLGEYLWGEGKGLDNIVYWTIGTGIGAGCIVDGKIVHGMKHPEMGHWFIPHDKQIDPFVGVCTYHQECLEGLASGTSMKKRWNLDKATDLPQDHFGWDLEARYLAYGMVNCILAISPEKIIIGGGVMKHQGLLTKIRKYTQDFLNYFIQNETILKEIENFIVPPKLGDDAGISGSFALADRAIKEPF